MCFQVSLFVIVKLIIWSSAEGAQPVVNLDAFHITCSGDVDIPSSLVVSGKLHPLHGMLILTPECDGGDDRFVATYPLPVNMRVWYEGNNTEQCVFTEGTATFGITVGVLTTNNTEIATFTVSCPKPLEATPALTESMPDFLLDQTVDIKDYVWQRCGDESNKLEFIPQAEDIIALLGCEDNQQSRVVISKTPVESELFLEGNTTVNCIFNNESSVSVDFFNADDFSYIGSSSMSHCLPRQDKKILKVFPHCGSAVGEPAWIRGVADVDADFRAVCKGDNVFLFDNLDNDDVNYKLLVGYDGNETAMCLFNRREKSEVYVILVKVSWGEKGAVVHKYTREYQVTCTFEASGSDESADQHVDDTLIAPKVIQQYEGEQAQSSVVLRLLDVLDRQVYQLPLGRMVRLRAISNGQTGEVGGIRPVGCDAVGITSGQRFAIIRAGCGDGIVFEKDEGFESEGLNSTSPYFKIFNMHNDPLIKFECNFTMCATSCPGDSCVDHDEGGDNAAVMLLRERRHSRDTKYLRYFKAETEEIKTIV